MKLHAFLAASLIFLNGCGLAPLADSVRRAGVTEQSRQSIIHEQLKYFHQALFWGSYMEAIGYVPPEHQPAVQVVLNQTKAKGRVIDHKIDNIEFTDDSYNADVDVKISYHETATNLIRPYQAKERWVFSLAHGWQLESIDQFERAAQG